MSSEDQRRDRAERALARDFRKEQAYYAAMQKRKAAAVAVVPADDAGDTSALSYFAQILRAILPFASAPTCAGHPMEGGHTPCMADSGRTLISCGEGNCAACVREHCYDT